MGNEFCIKGRIIKNHFSVDSSLDYLLVPSLDYLVNALILKSEIPSSIKLQRGVR